MRWCGTKGVYSLTTIRIDPVGGISEERNDMSVAPTTYAVPRNQDNSYQNGFLCVWGVITYPIVFLPSYAKLLIAIHIVTVCSNVELILIAERFGDLITGFKGLMTPYITPRRVLLNVFSIGNSQLKRVVVLERLFF